MPRPALADAEATRTLPALVCALDAPRLLARLGEAGAPPPGLGDRLEARLLGVKPGRRAVLRYDLVPEGGAPGRAILYAKLYRDPARAQRLDGRLRGLRERLPPRAAAAVPEPRGWLPDLGLVLLAPAPGVDLRGVAGGPQSEAAFGAAARWLEALHGAEPLEGLKRRSLAYEVSRVERFADEVASRLEGPVREGLARARAALARAPERLAPGKAAMIHKDFYYAHVLWDGARVSILDLDELGVGDPAFDVGHFLAHWRRHVARAAGTPAEAAEAFARAYPPSADPGFRRRVAFYAGYGLLKLAATEARRAREGWREHAERLVALAEREGERLLGEGEP
jgi:hypothetical protein